MRKTVEPPGEAREDWRIIMELSTGMGYSMRCSHPAEIWDELTAAAPIFASIAYARLEAGGHPVALPHGQRR